MDERLQKAEMQKSIEELAKMGNIKRIGHHYFPINAKKLE
jgi:hypothetical protein